MMYLRPWQLSVLLAGLCLILLAVVIYWRYDDQTTNAALLERLPNQDTAIHLFVDIQRLRQVGLLELLSGSRAAEETDYRQFVEDTRFDYRQDLDAVIASFVYGDSVFLLRGRFEWDQIQRTALRSGARCVNGYCQMETRRAGRFLSFYPVYPNVLAVGIGSTGNVASSVMARRKGSLNYDPPAMPFWISAAGPAIEKADLLPVGGKTLISAVKGARRVIFGIGEVPAGMAARMEAVFAAAPEAGACRDHLDQMTEMLRKFLARAAKSPDPGEFAGVLAAGKFQQSAAKVIGQWPIERAFLESLADGAR